ncbi:hypothetical protein DL96DRAFT_1594086 [Flagelloscypha sp. PMI_526]|nr:hypothetical protein DL96DRAFT_1594086 [Flagelloscypha sp. PMI_526]
MNAMVGSGGPPAGYPPFSNNGPPMSPYGEPPPSFNEVAAAPPPQPFGALEPPERTGSVPPPTRSVDDFGVAPQQLPGSKGPAGGRFATFPVKGPGGPRGIALRDDPPSLASRPPEAEESFSSSIAAALGTSDSFPSSSQPASQDSFTPARPPPGAAAPAAPGAGDSPWGSPSRGNFDDHARDNTENTDEPGLAYMYGGHEEEEAPHEAQEVEYEKKVRFNSGVPSPFTPYPDTPKFIPSGQNSPALSPMAEHYPPVPSISHDPSPSRRVPPPRFDPEDDAKARNAAAAEEIKREMDALSSDAIDNIGSPPPSEPVTAPLDLSPPSAPFTRRQISPRPSLDMNLRGPYDSGQQSQPGSFHETPSHIAPPYESPTREKPSSPLASYKLPSSPAASFGTPLNPSNDDLPSPRTKSHTQLPSISIDGNSAPSERSPAAHSPSGSFSYSTPPEYPRNMYNRSTSSLNQTAPMGSATGKISAAAFRRPQNRMGSSDLRAPGEVSPLNMKKRLPSSPYPEHRSTLSREASPSPGLDPPAPISAPVPSSPLAKPLSPALAQEDDDFDYIGAYVNANQDDIPPQPAASPPTVDYADYGKLGKMRIANEQSSGGRYDDLR